MFRTTWAFQPFDNVQENIEDAYNLKVSKREIRAP